MEGQKYPDVDCPCYFVIVRCFDNASIPKTLFGCIFSTLEFEYNVKTNTYHLLWITAVAFNDHWHY